MWNPPIRALSDAPWHEKLVKFTAPEFGQAQGSAAEGLVTPVRFHGADLRRLSAFSGEKHTGPHSDWCDYLEHSYAYFVDDTEGTLTLDASFFEECAQGEIRFVAEFFDGQTTEFWVRKTDDQVETMENPEA